MKILVLHRIPYHKIDYHRGLDHDAHEIVYLGESKALANIPADLRCQKVERQGAGVEACIVALAAAHQGEFHRIVSLSEYELILAAELRKQLGTVGPSIDDVLLVRDKVRMKGAVSTAGLAVPRHERASTVLQMGAMPLWEGRTVLKPTDGASSEGVEVFDSTLQALAALRAMPTSSLDEWELEEFVDGDILHFDGVVTDGSVAALVASRYLGTCLGYARGSPLGSVQIPLDIIAEPSGVSIWVKRCLAAVALRNGVFHLEAIATPQGLVFLEIGARVGGADVVACFELATGLHLPSAELALLSGASLPPIKNPTSYFGWFVYPGHISLQGQSGAISVLGTEGYRHDPCVFTWHERTVKVDPSSRISYQHMDVPLAGIVGSTSHLNLEAFLRSLFDRCRLCFQQQAVGSYAQSYPSIAQQES